MLTGLLFWRALCRPCDVTVKRMAPLEGTSELKLLPLLRGRLLDMVGALWLSQMATATPKCLYGGLASSLPTAHPHALLALY